jgi:PAS domain S-box-containing protein
VDDEADSRAMLASVFAQGGYALRLFEHGEDALAALEDASPSLMVLDLMMPRVDGFGVLKALRARDDLAAPPVLVLTAMTSESTLINAFELGAADVVHKPFRVTELLARVRAMLVRRASHDALELELRRARALESLTARLSGLGELEARLELLCGALGLPCQGVFELDGLGGLKEIDGARALESWWDEELSEALRAGRRAQLGEESARALALSSPSWALPCALDADRPGALIVGCPGAADDDALDHAACVIACYERLSGAGHAPPEPDPEATRDATTRLLTSVIASSPDAIVAADRDGWITLFNPAAERMLGWTSEQALGMSVRRLYPRGTAEALMQRMRDGSRGDRGRLEASREEALDARGRRIPVDISAAIIYEDGEEAGTVGIFTDVRARLEMEQRLRRVTQDLERRRDLEMVAELAGATAHELNQPLMSMLAYAEMLERNTDRDPAERKALETIVSEAERMAEIVRRLSHVTRYKTKEYVDGTVIVDLEQSSDVWED